MAVAELEPVTETIAAPEPTWQAGSWALPTPQGVLSRGPVALRDGCLILAVKSPLTVNALAASGRRTDNEKIAALAIRDRVEVAVEAAREVHAAATRELHEFSGRPQLESARAAAAEAHWQALRLDPEAKSEDLRSAEQAVKSAKVNAAEAVQMHGTHMARVHEAKLRLESAIKAACSSAGEELQQEAQAMKARALDDILVREDAALRRLVLWHESANVDRRALAAAVAEEMLAKGGQ